MNSKIQDVVKAGVLFFAVGALLSLAAPYIALAVGLAPTAAGAAALLGPTANPLWLGAFFSAFGAIDAAIRPLFDRLSPPASAAAAMPDTAQGPAQEVAVSMAQDKIQEMENRHRQQLQAERDARSEERAAGI